MRRYIVAIVSIFALSASCAALAQDPQTLVATDRNSVAAQSGLICHFVYHEGMVIGRSCRTKAQWDSTRFQTQHEISDFQLRSLTGHM